MYVVVKATVKIDFLLKTFNKREKIKRYFKRFNLNHCFYYSIHAVILIIACKPDPNRTYGEKKKKITQGKSDDLVSRNSHDVPVISLWILLFIKHMQNYKMTIIMQVIYI